MTQATQLTVIPGGRGDALIIGSAGEAVRELQESLAHWGFSPGEFEGQYGVKTAESVSALQRKLGIPATGEFDAATARAVREDLREPESSVMREFVAPPADLQGQDIGSWGDAPTADPVPSVSTAFGIPTAPLLLAGAGAALYWLMHKKVKVTFEGLGFDRATLEAEDRADDGEITVKVKGKKPRRRARTRKPRAAKVKAAPAKRKKTDAQVAIIDVTPIHRA